MSSKMSEVGKKLRGFVRDERLYQLFHRDTNTSLAATQAALKAMRTLGASPSNIHGLITGQRAVSNGWCLLENAEWAYDYAAPKSGDQHYKRINKIAA